MAEDPSKVPAGKKSDPSFSVEVPTGDPKEKEQEEGQNNKFLPLVLKSMAVSVGALLVAGASAAYLNGRTVSQPQKVAIGISSVVAGGWAYQRFSKDQQSDKNYKVYKDPSLLIPFGVAVGAPLIASFFVTNK